MPPLIGAAVIALVWLPFIAAGGPLKYLDNLTAYQNGVFSVLSLRAWNPWWVIQELGAGGNFVADGTAILGPLSFRTLGFVIAGLLSIVVFVGVYRRPTAEQLALGLAAITLVAFVSLTTMHERYAYPALVFLLVAAAGNRASPALPILWAVFAVIFALNLVIAVPPGPDLVGPGAVRRPVDGRRLGGDDGDRGAAGAAGRPAGRRSVDEPAPGIVGRWLARPRSRAAPIAPMSWSGSPRSPASGCWSPWGSG